MKCPHCQQEHPDNAKFCPVSGQEIPQPETNVQNEEPESTTCPNCGKPIATVGKFCPHCGFLLAKSGIEEKTKIVKPTPASQVPPKKKHKPRVLATIFIVIFVIAMLAIGFFLVQDYLPNTILSSAIHTIPSHTEEEVIEFETETIATSILPLITPDSSETPEVFEKTEIILPQITAIKTHTSIPELSIPINCTVDEFGCAKIIKGQTIKIGMGAPLTGDYAVFGVDISQGATIAVNDAETVEGFTFELVALDTQGSPDGGVAVAKKMVSDPTIVAIAGHIFSGSTEAALPIYEKAGLPMMSPSATNPPLTALGSKVFNRVAFTDAMQSQFAADYLYNKLDFRKIVVLHDGRAYGKGLAEVVKEQFTTMGGEIVGFEAITPGESDYTKILSAFATQSPQAVYFGGYVAEGVVLTKNMKQSGLENVVFFGCDGTFGTEYIKKTGANGEGAYAASVIPPESVAKMKFDAAYLAAYGVEAGTLSPYTWNGYDSAAVLIAKVKEVALLGADGNLYIPRGALVNAVRATSGFSSITGIITCNEVGECNTSGPTFFVVNDGKWVEAP